MKGGREVRRRKEVRPRSKKAKKNYEWGVMNRRKAKGRAEDKGYGGRQRVGRKTGKVRVTWYGER